MGFNETLTASVERKGDQYQPLTECDSDPKTTVFVISGSVRPVLDRNFNEYDPWLAAENEIFLNPSEGEWVTIMPKQLNIEGGHNMKHVFDYFTDRTPRSYFEEWEASLVWIYKHSFQRQQARDMLQYFETVPIPNKTVEVV